MHASEAGAHAGWMAWDRCDQDSVWRDIECAALLGEDTPLCPDFPDLDLSELDVSDLGAEPLFLGGGSKWFGGGAYEPYANEACNLFEKLDEEQEATLLAALSDTLDCFPVAIDDDESLPDEEEMPAYDEEEDHAPPASPRANQVQAGIGGLGRRRSRANQRAGWRPPLGVSPTHSSGSPEGEEPSLLKRLLLAPPVSNVNQVKSLHHHGNGYKHRHSHLKPEASWTLKRGCVSVRRPCTELLKHLTTSSSSMTSSLPSDTTIVTETSSSASCSPSPPSSRCSESSSPLIGLEGGGHTPKAINSDITSCSQPLEITSLPEEVCSLQR